MVLLFVFYEAMGRPCIFGLFASEGPYRSHQMTEIASRRTCHWAGVHRGGYRDLLGSPGNPKVVRHGGKISSDTLSREKYVNPAWMPRVRNLPGRPYRGEVHAEVSLSIKLRFKMGRRRSCGDEDSFPANEGGMSDWSDFNFTPHLFRPEHTKSRIGMKRIGGDGTSQSRQLIFQVIQEQTDFLFFSWN